MTQGLVLVGASGLAREAMNLVRAWDAVSGNRTSMVVLDDDPATWERRIGEVEVEGGLSGLSDHPDHEILICVGRGDRRRGIVERIRRSGVGRDRFATLVHPRVQIPEDSSVGVGSIVMEGVVVTADVSLDDHTVVMPHVTLTHGDVVESHATLCAGVALGGDVHVGSGAYVGMNAGVRERVRIGRDAVLGMGSALLQDLPDGERWAGSPARPLDQRMEVTR